MRTAAFALLAAAGLASASNAVVKNNCNFPVYLWSVGGSVGPEQTLNTGQSYSETIHYDSASGGVAIKLTTTPNGLYDGSPETIFAYSLSGNLVYYDLSDVFGDAFSGHPVDLSPSDTSCPVVDWPNGTPPPSGSFACQSGSDLTLTLC
jgi:hypothetical protein